MAAESPFLLSSASSQALELPSLLAVLAQLAATDLGRDLILELRPFAAETALRAHRRRYEEAVRLLTEQPLVPDFEAPIGQLLRRLASGLPPLEGIDVVRLADLGRASRAVALRLRTADPPCPELAAAAAAAVLPEIEPLLRRIDRTLDRRGEVREDASPLLAALRRQIRQVRDHLYRELGEYVSQHRDELSEDTIPLRGGRLVVVQAAGARGRSGGLVHGRSATGKSFYFEPLQAVEPNNSLQQASEDEEAERRRLLAELLAELRAALPALAACGAFLGTLDLLQAAARFAALCGGRLADLSPRHQLSLVAARHPLLDPALAELRAAALGHAGHGGVIVPLDVELDAARRILVITGPNAGGKTVALKTIGLLALATRCGLPIPAAAGSRVPPLRAIVATVGDEQDLLADRSTFSGRLLRLREAWEAAEPVPAGDLASPGVSGRSAAPVGSPAANPATAVALAALPGAARAAGDPAAVQEAAASRLVPPGAESAAAPRSAPSAGGQPGDADSLILLDELGSGTDPEEGAALAVALLEGLLARGSLAVITTHLTQLAAAALERPGATCAAMEFDGETGRPTFHLQPGPPGGSEALALARRLGLPAAWLDRAEALLGSGHRDLRRLIAEVEQLRQDLHRERERLAAEISDAEKLRHRQEAELRALDQEKREVGRHARAELETFRRDTAERLRREVGRLEESFAAGRRRGLVAEAVERLFAEAPALGGEAPPEAAGPLAVGGPVRHLGLGWHGVLQKLEGDRAEVLVHGKRVRARAAELAGAAPAAGSAGSAGVAGSAGAAGAQGTRGNAGAVPSHGGDGGAGRRGVGAAGRAAAAQAAAGTGRRHRGGDLDETAAVPAEINLIGVRVEPALEQLDGYLDRALLAARREVRVIHGHGTGRLRQAVREHLRGHPAVSELRGGEANEGGNGATVVTLRDRPGRSGG
jgi:DNA mismatch repair protein MutS2